MTTPIILAALARKPRRNPRAVHTAGGKGEGKNPPHNYLAQAPKRQAGAPLGNRNAARPASENRDRHAKLDALIHALHASADAAIASCEQAALERAVLAALLETPR
jgi:hypothetical protein